VTNVSRPASVVVSARDLVPNGVRHPGAAAHLDGGFYPAVRGG